MIKKKFYIFLASIISLYSTVYNASAFSSNEIDPNGSSILDTGLTQSGVWWITWFLVFLKALLFNILWILVVGAFIYVWYTFVTARGNPEEFKKAWIQTIYIVVGIALVSSAWWIVSLISGLDF